MSILLEDIEDLVEESQIYEELGKEGVVKGLAEIWNNRRYWGGGQEIQSRLNPDESPETIATKGLTNSLKELWSNRKFWGSGQEIQAQIKDNVHSTNVNARAERLLANAEFNKMGNPDLNENIYDANFLDHVSHTFKQLKNATESSFNSIVDNFFKTFKSVPGIDSIKEFSETNPKVFTALVVAIPLVVLGAGAFVGYRKIKGMNSPQQAKKAMDAAKAKIESAKSEKEKEKAEKDYALYSAKYLTLSKKK